MQGPLMPPVDTFSKGHGDPGSTRPFLVFDLPLLELAAFRYGCPARDYFHSSRNRLGGGHIDLMDWLTNYGAVRLSGGLDLLSKLLGMPGKMTVSGEQVYRMHLEGLTQE